MMHKRPCAPPGRPKALSTAVRSTKVLQCAPPGRPKAPSTAVRSTQVLQ